MSHACGRRDACRTTFWVLWFHFENPSIARGVTDIGVGSGALLGRFCRGRKWLGLKSMIMVNRLGASSLRWCCNLESHLSFETETFLRLRSRAGHFLIAATSRQRAAKTCGLSPHRDRIARPTSKMSHDRGRRAACRTTTWVLWFHFGTDSIARGVTDMVVGSGALLALFYFASSMSVMRSSRTA